MLTLARRSGPVSVMMTWTISPGRSVIGNAVSACALSKTVSRSAAGASVWRQMPFSVRPVASSKRTIRSSTGRPPSNTTTSSCAGSVIEPRGDSWAEPSCAFAGGVSAIPTAISTRPSSMPTRVSRESRIILSAHPGAFGALLHGPSKLDRAAEQVTAGELLQVLFGTREVAGLEQGVGQCITDVLVAQQADPDQVPLHAGGLLEAVEFQEDRQALLELLRLVYDLCIQRERLDQPAGALVKLGGIRGQAVVVERGGAHHVGGGQFAPLVEVDVGQDFAQHHVFGCRKAGLLENHRGLAVLPGLAQRVADGDRVVAGAQAAFEKLKTLVGRFLVKPLVDQQKDLPAGKIAGTIGKFRAPPAQNFPGGGVVFEFPVGLGAHQEH